MPEGYFTVSGEPKRLPGEDNYHNVTDSVFFNEFNGSVLWKHAANTQVNEGTKVYGQVETLTAASGKEYNKFTKKQVPDNTSVSAVGGNKPSATGGAEFSDGAKRGMAINNASAYVIAQAAYDNARLEPEEFAAEVQRYAKEIYKIDPCAKNESDELLEFLNQA